MPEMICPFCKKTWPQDFRWCMEDGAELEQNMGQYEQEEDAGIPGMECPECGARIDPRDEFCAGCGVRLQSREEAEAVVAQFSCQGCGAAINPADPFCGKCGARIGDAQQGPAAPSAATAGACPNCGMQNTPGDPFCGTCGQQLAATTPAPAPRATAPGPQNLICPQCSLEHPQGTDYCHSCGYQFVKPVEAAATGAGIQSGMGSCPNCGMDVQPGDPFCGTCGYNISGAAPAPAAQTARSSGIPCPNCGTDNSPVDTFCAACGASLTDTDQGPAPAAAYTTPSGTASCPNCGMAVQSGETICATCGYGLVESAEPLETPASHDAGHSAPDGSCPNCGMAMHPGETMCATCGFQPDQAFDEPAPAVYDAAPAPASAPASSCSNCGMDITPGDTFCGTCGADLTGATTDSAPQDSGGIDLNTPELQISEAKLALRCPECGSNRTTKGGAFCEVCGAMVGQQEQEPSEYLDYEPEENPDGVRAGDLADPFAPRPSEGDLSGKQPLTSLADITGSDPVCPECGVEGYPGMESCASCGARLVPQAEVIEATAGILHTPTPSLESLAAQAPPAPAIAPDAPSLGDITGDVLVCEECGMVAPEGARDACLGCGGALIKGHEQVAQTQATLYAPPPPPAAPAAVEDMPPPPPMPTAAATDGAEKICSCCGTPNPADTEFCAVCGVDFS